MSGPAVRTIESKKPRREEQVSLELLDRAPYRKPAGDSAFSFELFSSCQGSLPKSGDSGCNRATEPPLSRFLVARNMARDASFQESRHALKSGH